MRAAGEASTVRSIPRMVTAGGVTLLLAIGAWLALSRILASDRGLDMTDEGLHLLSADPPTPDGVWWTPWILDTKPLFAVVGYDIASFRTLGAVILVLVAGAAGFLLTAALRTLGVTPKRLDVIVSAGAGVTALAHYSWFMRTPNYDWLGLVGMLVSLCGVLLLLRPAIGQTTRRPPRVMAGALAGFGAWLVIPARPTMFILLALAALVIVWAAHGRRAIALPSVAWLSAVLLSTALAFATGLWPRELPAVAWGLATGYEPLTRQQTIVGMMGDVLQLPLTFATNAWLTPQVLKYPLLLLLVIFAVLVTRGISRWPVVVAALIGLVLVLSVSATGHVESLDQAMTAATVVVIVLALVAVAARLWPDRLGVEIGTSPWSRTALATASTLLALDLLVGLGSINGSYAMAAKALVILYLGSIALAFSVRSRRAVVFGTLFSTVVLSLVTVRLLVIGYQHPLSLQAGMSEQTVSVTVGPRASALRMDADSAQYVAGLNALRSDSCWTPGTRLLGAEWQWTTTDAYVLGAQAPPSLMLSILYANEAALQNLDLSLTRIDSSDWSDSWLVTTDPSHIPPEGEQTVSRALDRITGHLGTRFPDDYRLIRQVGSSQFWAPAAVAEACASS